MAIALLVAFANAQATERRIALVVGNSAYADKPLRNAVNDAELMQRTLKDLGFEVTLLRNADRRAMLGGLRDFEAKARNADVALFFYAGHGTQVGGSNYLIPLQAQIRAESDVPDEAVDAASVLRRIEDAKARVGLVILDACRDNPYAGASRSSSRGLGRMSVPTGSIVAYAAAPGETADDGKGANGLYTEQLVHNLNQSGLDLREVFDRTATEVERITNGKQRPREDVGLRGRFVLKTGSGVQVVSLNSEPTMRLAQSDPEEDAWQAAKAVNTPAAFDAYLSEYPNGKYGSAARIARGTYQHVATTPATSTSAPDALPSPSATGKPGDAVMLEFLRRFGPTATAAVDAISVFGLTVVELTSTQRSETKIEGGASVLTVVGPAAKAGLQEGDIVLSVANKTISSAADFNAAVIGHDKTKPLVVLARRGEASKFVVIRAGTQ